MCGKYLREFVLYKLTKVNARILEFCEDIESCKHCFEFASLTDVMACFSVKHAPRVARQSR